MNILPDAMIFLGSSNFNMIISWPFFLQIQGAIMLASIFQVLIGFSGLMGFVMRFIGPLVVAPTISLIGLALFDTASEFAKKQWWITLVFVLI